MVAPGAAADNSQDLVQQAVEDFIDRCAAGEEPKPEQFASGWPEGVRERILEQCRNFLHFDDFVGRQAWSQDELQQPSGRTFGDFVIQEELGRGGMGVVYLAHQRSLNRRVALKVMASGLTLSKRHVERFRREATAAASLRHPGIVPVHSFTEVDGTFAFAMDYIAGRNLGEILDDLRLLSAPNNTHVEGTLGLQPESGYVAECALLCAQIAGALSAAHAAGIAHRDIKPRNLMIDEHRQARLLDFGLAKSLDQGSISMSGEITGTAHYMSPEQTLAKRVELDHRTDIFSLGVILYELLTLKRPFDGKNLQQIVYEICFKEPVPIPKLNPKVPRDLVTICGKALEKDPQNRYQTATEFEADLQRFLRWEPIHARPAGVLTRIAKWAHRHRTETLALAVLCGGVLTAAGIWWFRAAELAAAFDQRLTLAQSAADGGDFKAAIDHATRALELRPSDEVRTRLELYRNAERLLATEEQRRIAEANLMLARSSKALERDRELALVFALKAVDHRDSYLARSAVLDALGAGYKTTRFQHATEAVKAALSPDGAVMASIVLNEPAVLWDAATGSERCRLDGHGPALDLAFHPNGRQLATADVHGGVTLWNLADGKAAAHFELLGKAESVQFDRAGEHLLGVSYDDYGKGPFLAQVWDVGSRQPLGACALHTRIVEIARISPCGQYVASYGDQGFVRLWDANTGTELAQLQDHRVRVRDLAFAADSSLLATADNDGAVRVFAVPSGRLLAPPMRHSKCVHSVRFDGDGTHLLTASLDQTARLWRFDQKAGTAIEVLTLLGHGDAVTRAEFDETGERAVTACKDMVARVFDLSNGAELMHYEVGKAVEDAAFDATGRKVLVRATGGTVLLWDLEGAGGTMRLRHKSFVRAACYDNGGRHVVTAGDDERESVNIWNAKDGALVRTIRLGDPVFAVDVDPHSTRILIATFAGKLEFYGMDGNRIGGLAGHQQKVNAASFAMDGERVVSCSDDRTAVVWNARDATEICRIERPLPVVAASLANDGTVLATVEQGERVARLWSVPAGALLRELGGHQGPLRTVAFVPASAQLLTAGDDGIARLWQLDGVQVRNYAAGVPLQQVAFDRSGKWLLTCSSKPIAQLWDVQSGDLRLRYTGHRGAIAGGALDADGSWAVTCSKDNTAHVWPTDPVAVARRQELRELTASERRDLGLPDPPPPTTK